MGIDVSAPVAGVGGGLLLAGGGAVAAQGRARIKAATDLAQFATPPQVMPALRDLQDTLTASDEVLDGVQRAMRDVRLPGTGLFRRIPLLGGAADDLERAARLGAAAHQLAKLDETRLVTAARDLTAQTTQLVAAAEGDVARLGAAQARLGSGTTRLLAGGVAAAAGAFLLASAVFDVS